MDGQVDPLLDDGTTGDTTNEHIEAGVHEGTLTCAGQEVHRGGVLRVCHKGEVSTSHQPISSTS